MQTQMKKLKPKKLSLRQKELLLQKLYYNLQYPSAFGTPKTLFEEVKKNGTSIRLWFIKKWLKRQPAYYLHKQRRLQFPRRKTMVPKIEFQYQADLIILLNLAKYNDKCKYILTCIDCFSRFGFAEAIKTKRPKDVLPALRKILKNKNITLMQTDRGGEFYSKEVRAFFESKGIHHFSTTSTNKASICERFNKSLLSILYRYFSGMNTLRYVDILPQLVSSYNNRFHRSIQMAPSKVNQKNQKTVYKTLYDNNSKLKNTFKSQFKIGDTVIVAKERKTFQKGYLPLWGKVIHSVADVYKTNPPTYKLMNKEKEILPGIYYKEEIQHVQPN
jgi:hypothetical protein